MTRVSDVDVPDWLDVSRETSGRLNQFVGLVQKWNPTINLVSKRSANELWDRHILDSAQLFALIPKASRHLADLGSGGGFPGMVLAILASELLPELRVTLVEVDRRKATFLSEAARQLSLRCAVETQRIETLAPLNADVLTARALAPLAVLCGYAERHLATGGLALFAKGAQVDDEIREARQSWAFDMQQRVSRSDPDGRILALREIRHV